MKDKDKIVAIIEIFDKIIHLTNVSKDEFLNNIILRKKVETLLKKSSVLGISISKYIKNDYKFTFVWTLFNILKNWSIEKDDDISWDMIKGYSFKKHKYDSLKDYKNELERIWIAEFVLRRKGQLPHDIHKISKDLLFSYSKKIIYTPMGNKR